MVNETKLKKPRGRPEKFPGEGARIGHSLRIKPSVDKIVRAAAEKNCRSISEEIEHRLNQTVEKVFVAFEDDALLTRIKSDAASNHRDVWEEARIKIRDNVYMEDIFQHRDTFAILMSIARDIGELELKTNNNLKSIIEEQGSSAASDIVRIIENRIFGELHQNVLMSEVVKNYENRRNSHNEEEKEIHEILSTVDITEI